MGHKHGSVRNKMKILVLTREFMFILEGATLVLFVQMLFHILSPLGGNVGSLME